MLATYPIDLGTFWEAVLPLLLFPCKVKQRGFSSKFFSSSLACLFVNYLLQNEAQWRLERQNSAAALRAG